MGVRTVTGLLSVLGMLVLASPGVRAERVEAPSTASDAGPQCSANPAARSSGADAAFVANLRRERWQRLQADAEAQGIVVLNGRGFNYPRDSTGPPQPPPR